MFDFPLLNFVVRKLEHYAAALLFVSVAAFSFVGGLEIAEYLGEEGGFLLLLFKGALERLRSKVVIDETGGLRGVRKDHLSHSTQLFSHHNSRTVSSDLFQPELLIFALLYFRRRTELLVGVPKVASYVTEPVEAVQRLECFFIVVLLLHVHFYPSRLDAFFC